MTKWGIKITSEEECKGAWYEFDADGHGKVLFDEFSNWAIKKGLDLDDDDDVDDSGM